MGGKSTAVIFRRWRRNSRSVIALFPEQKQSNGLIDCYEHVGQHGLADYTHVMIHTGPVASDDAEAQELAAELETIGYTLAVRQRRRN